jgi:hypothetical protein
VNIIKTFLKDISNIMKNKLNEKRWGREEVN